MIRKPIAAVPPVLIDKDGFQGMTARFALTAADGCPNYALRIMEFAPGGHTSLHAHQEEHLFYFFEGRPALVDGTGRRTEIAPGEAVFVAPNEPHQIVNLGDTTLRVVCTIPILPGGDGKTTRPTAAR